MIVIFDLQRISVYTYIFTWTTFDKSFADTVCVFILYIGRHIPISHPTVTNWCAIQWITDILFHVLLICLGWGGDPDCSFRQLLHQMGEPLSCWQTAITNVWSLLGNTRMGGKLLIKYISTIMHTAHASLCLLVLVIENQLGLLPHWGRDKIAALFQTTYSMSFSSM